MGEKHWWERLPARLLDEDRELQALHVTDPPLVQTHRWFREANGEPRLRVVLAAPLGASELEIRFPPHYPDGCPSVRPVPYDKPITSHQFTSSGVFCLELGPDNWHPRFTAADMVRSAWRLLVLETLGRMVPPEERIEIPSRHVSDLAEQVRFGDGVFVQASSLAERFTQAGPANTEFEFVWSDRHALHVCPVSFPKGTPIAEVPPGLLRTHKYTGVYCMLAPNAPSNTPTTRPEFDAFIAAHAPAPVSDGARLVVLRWPSGETYAYFRLDTTVCRLVAFPLDLHSSTRTPTPLVERITAVRVGIVGMGSLGSKVAVSLARTGVRRFVLVDSDVLEGPNVCRHAAGFHDVGTLKVDAVKQAVRDVSLSEPEITRHSLNVASATHPEVHAKALEDLGDSDVLVDATASPDAFGVIAMIASNRKRPMAWGEVFGAGLGGLLASAHPSTGPCPRCVRAAFLAQANAWPPAPARVAAIPYGGGEAQPIVATDADVGALAAALTRRVLDLISSEDECRPAIVLLGAKRGWIFDAPMQSIGVEARSDDWHCTRCWTPDAAPDAATTALAEALFDTHGDDPPTR